MTIKGGYYMKARQIQDSEIAHSPPCVREVWDYLLREANHKDVKYNGFIVKRGQLFRTYKDIREALYWMVGWRKETYNENSMKRAMKHLKKNTMIDTRKEPRGMLITVLNYGKYQDPKNYESTTNVPTKTPANEPQVNQSRPSINKNEKNVKNERSNIILHSEQDSQGNEINELIALFEPVNKGYKRFFKNKTQRKAIEELVKDHGIEEVTRLIKGLEWLGTQEYVATIVTPCQLRDKLGEYERAIKKVKATQTNKMGITI